MEEPLSDEGQWLRVQRVIQRMLDGGPLVDVKEALDFVVRAKCGLESRLKSLRPPKRRGMRKKKCILRHCHTTPGDSVVATLGRVENALSRERWMQPGGIGELDDLLASPAHFSGIEVYTLPLERVAFAGLKVESRSAVISRIRNMVIADAITTFIDNTGSVRTSLRPALGGLAAKIHSNDIKSLNNWRKAGEWLIEFFQRIPLGAICMMDNQTTVWGTVLGKGYIDPIVRYCESLPGFIAHAMELTPAASAAVRTWAAGCAYRLDPDSSLGQLVPVQEEGHGRDVVRVRSLSTSSPAVRGDVENNSIMPSPPLACWTPERLFREIKVYFENCCRTMAFDDSGTLLSPDGAELRNDLCNDFDSYCFTATMLKEKGLHVEFGAALSKAFALVGDILRAEHPRTLPCFFEVLTHLEQTGLPDVALMLRDFVKRMSAEVNREDSGWGRICMHLGELDPACLADAMAQAWRCIADTLDAELGPATRIAVSVRLDYMKRTTTDFLKEEIQLRHLSDLLEGTPKYATLRVKLNLAENLKKQNRHPEVEEIVLDVLSLLENVEMYAGMDAQRIESLKVLSHSQRSQDKTSEAEKTMRTAIQKIVDCWGHTHPWVLEFTNVLEAWLRGWGRDEDANTLREEIGRMIRVDILSEQLDSGDRRCSDEGKAEPWRRVKVCTPCQNGMTQA